MDLRWSLERMDPPPERPMDVPYYRLFSEGPHKCLVIVASPANDEILGDLLADANRGAQAKAEDEAIDRVVDAGIVEARERTPAQSADGFLRDALVMLADRKRFAGDINCGSAVRAIGKALERVGCMIALESLERSPTPSDQPAQEAPDAP